MSDVVQPVTRAILQDRLERARAQSSPLHDEALEALRALEDWDTEHGASQR